MDVLKYFFIYTVYAITEVSSEPPAACFADFRWEDCGKAPVAVMYYWKPGSRCEVGLWRGCLPNINMFKDEYECVSTCIFTVRAMPEDYHNIFGDDDGSNIGMVPSDDVTVAVEGNGTDPTTAGGEDKTDSGGATTVGADGSGTGAGDGTGPAGTSGGEAATTAAAAAVAEGGE